MDLHNYPRDQAAIPAVIRECFTDIQATRDYIITTSSSGYVRVLNSISLREVTSMNVFSLNLHREGGQGYPPEGMIYAPLSHLRILSTVVFEQTAEPGLKTAAGRNAVSTNGDRSSSNHISPTVISSRHVVLSIVSLEPAPLSAEAAAEAQAALAAAATKKKPPPAKGAAEQPIVESATLYRLLVLDVLKHEETHGDAKEGKEYEGEKKERVGVQATQQVNGRQATGETIAQPARIEVINELFLQLPSSSSSSVSSADTVHELMPSLMWDRIGVEMSKDGCFMSVVGGLPLGEACKLYALQPPKKIEVAMGMTTTMTMMEQSSNSIDQLPDDELLLQEIPAVTVTSPAVIAHLPSNAPFLLGGRLKSLRMVPNYRTLLNRDAAKQKMKTKTTEMMNMKEARQDEEHRDSSSYLLLKAFTEQTMLVVSLQDVHAALIVGLRLKSEDELVAKVSNAPPVLDAKGKAKPPSNDIKAPPSNTNANAAAVTAGEDNPTPIDMYLISQFKLTAALTAYAVDSSLRVLLATGTSDGTVTLWNLAQLSMVDCLGKHPSAVTCLSVQRNHVPHLTALSKASVSVVSGAVDGTLCFFKAEAVGAGVGIGAGVAAASRASQLSVTIKGEHSPSSSPPAHRRRDRSTSTTPGGGTAGILSRRRLDTAASRPSLLPDSSREGLEAIEHVVLKDYRSDVVVDTAAVGAACVLDIRHHDYLPLVYVQYSNGMMVMYDCLNLQLLGRLEKRERINYVNIFSVMTSAHTLQGFDDPVKRAAAIQKAIDDAAAAERQRIELLEQLTKAAAVEAEKAKKAGKPVPEPVITPAVVGVAAKVEEEMSKNANKDRGGIDDDDDLSVSTVAAVELTENEINAIPYDAIRGKVIDRKTSRFTYDYTWHTHRFLMTITHGHVVCLSERRGLVNIVMYPLDAMVDDMLSTAAAQGSHSVASAPLDTGKAAASVPKNMSKRVADTYSHLDHTMTSIDGKGTLKPLGKLRLTEERLHALDSSIAAVPVAADRRGDMSRDIIISSSSHSHSHTAASSHRDLFFSRSAFDQQLQQQSTNAQTPFQLLQLNAVIVDPERIAQTAMVRSKQERERRKAKLQASSKVLANMLKPAVVCAT